MAINRFSLIEAIFEARKCKNDEVYDELLTIYHRMLEQEEINDFFITKFVALDQVSESASEILSQCLAVTNSR